MGLYLLGFSAAILSAVVIADCPRPMKKLPDHGIAHLQDAEMVQRKLTIVAKTKTFVFEAGKR